MGISIGKKANEYKAQSRRFANLQAKQPATSFANASAR